MIHKVCSKKVKQLLVLFVETIFLFSTFLNAKALKMKYEPPYSYGINIGTSIHLHPYTDDGFDIEFANYSKNASLFPFASVFFQFRFFERIFGTTVKLAYNNRMISQTSGLDSSTIDINLHCVDAALLFNILPKGYGGINIYAGPQIYFLIDANSKKYNYRNVLVANNDLGQKYETYNIGALLGFNLEIDRTGILLGVEYDYFFGQINSPLKLYSEDILNLDLEEELRKRMQKSSSFRFYMGYDFGRFHCGE